MTAEGRRGMARQTYAARVADLETCGDTSTVRFDRPEGFSFDAGQYLRLTLETAEGTQTKSFSIASAPDDGFIEIATRLTGSAFKNALTSLTVGDEVHFEAPFGRLVVPEGTRAACFIAGGVGITPARSIIRDQEHRATGLEMRLFYGNMAESCIPFADELTSYQRSDAHYRCIQVIAEPSAGWTGERGFITADTVRRHLDLAQGWHFFVTGPPAMITAMRRVLDDLGVAAEDASIEDFAGY